MAETKIPGQKPTKAAFTSMVPRNPEEQHRAATTLELLYDLCFVVAIAFAASSLHHSINHGHALDGLISFTLVFFAIWWAWVNFTWFASAFDTDDVPYRLKVLVQMTGLMIISAGVPRAFEQQDWSYITLGYSIMRIGLIAQWLRVAKSVKPYRKVALCYVLGISICQIGWISLLFFPKDIWIYGWLILAPAELLVPAIAERAGKTPWHAEHISERYGLLTIIVIGESVLAATTAVQSTIDGSKYLVELLPIILGSPLIIFSMWWLYFSNSSHEILTSSRRAFTWGYVHYFLFGSIAAVGAGIGVAADYATHQSHISSLMAGMTLAIPLCVYLLSLWVVLVLPRKEKSVVSIAFICIGSMLLLSAFLPA
jgi:low temperature requirement protein LtrA